MIVRFSKEPPLNALHAAMLRRYHPLLLFTMLSTKAPFLLADSPIIDGSLTGETHLVKLVATMNCVQSLDGGRKQQQLLMISQCVDSS